MSTEFAELHGAVPLDPLDTSIEDGDIPPDVREKFELLVAWLRKTMARATQDFQARHADKVKTVVVGVHALPM